MLNWGNNTMISFVKRSVRSSYVHLDIVEGRFEFRPTEIQRPSSKESIANILREASQTGRSVTVVGSRHSWSDIAVPEDIMLSLENYAGVVDIDKANKLATVRGGTTLEDIMISLEAEGLALPQLPSVSAQTVAGAIATGVHIHEC